MVDEQTVLIFGFQILALFSITGALILYLLFKISSPPNIPTTLTGTKPSILITSINNEIGKQLARYLALKNYRVFAGNAQLIDADLSKKPFIIQNENIIEIPLSVTREDILHEAVDLIRSHLPAGEDGLWAVINTGHDNNDFQNQESLSTHWDTMFRTNVLGILRLARIFSNLLRIGRGRLISISFQNNFDEFNSKVVLNATNSAISAVCDALRNDFCHSGIKIVNLSLYFDFQNTNNEKVNNLLDEFFITIDESLTSTNPKNYYSISRNHRNFLINPLKVF